MAMVSRPDFLPNLPTWSRKTLFALALAAICFAFAFPVLWLILTSLRPESGVYYVHRGTEFTLGSFAEVLSDDRIVGAFINSALIATLATVFSLLVTVSSGYMLSRFTGPASRIWFGTIYVFRCVPYISWVLPLYFVTQSWGIYDTYTGILLPHVAVHICFFSWLMKGFFDGIDPSMEYAGALGDTRNLGACRAMLAVHLERVSVRADPDRQPRADDHGCHGAVRHRDGTALEPDGGNRRDGAGAGVSDRAVRAEICDPGVTHLKDQETQAQ
jgi:multiple sugar transport system permease protein